MKIALAITGFPRFFSETYEPIRRYILDAHDAKTFAAIYEPCPEREYGRVVWPYSRRSYFRDAFISEFSQCYKPIGGLDVKIFVDELPRLVTESNDIPRSTGRTYAHRGIYSQVETWAKTADLIRASGEQFDLVIKHRTDVIIQDFNADLEAIAQSDDLFVANNNAMGWNVGPNGECGGPGGICELMWIAKPETHFKFVEGLWANIKDYAKRIESCHAERLAGTHASEAGIRVSTFPCKLAFMADDPDVWAGKFQFRDEMSP